MYLLPVIGSISEKIYKLFKEILYQLFFEYNSPLRFVIALLCCRCSIKYLIGV
jgi:hypothetical protein